MSRQVAISLLTVGWQIDFTLTCANDARFTEHQDFEIVSGGSRFRVGKPMQVTNGSDGSTAVRMVANERDRDANLKALRALPNVSDVRVVR